MKNKRSVALLTGLLVVAMTGALSGCGGARARFNSHLRRGQELLAAGNLDKASVEFRNASQIEPKNPQVLYFNGKVAEARGNIRDAYGFYQASVDADAGQDLARAGAAKMLVFSGGSKRALTLIDPGLTLHPNSADLLAVRAAAHQQLKQPEEARADAENAVRIAPGNVSALTVLAALYADDKEYPRAILLISEALVHAPKSVELREVLANLFLASGDNQKAREQMLAVIDLEPLELTPRSQLAVFLSRTHDLEGAQKVLEEAVQAFSKSQQQSKSDAAKLMLVDFIAAQRSREQGEKTLRGFITHDPDNLELRLGLGALLLKANAVDEAFAVYREVVTKDGTGVKGLQARDRMAAIEIRRNHAAGARKLLAEVLEKNPRDDDALILRSALAMKQNDADGAIADLRAVLRNQPNSASLQRSLATAYLAKGQTGLAEEALRAAMRVAPADPAIRIEIAQLLTRTDRAPQALALLEETVKVIPNDLAAREALVKAYLSAGSLKEAGTLADDLKARQPQSPAGFYYAGLVAAREKRWDASQQDLDTALKLQPGRFDVLTTWVQVQVARGAPDAALSKVQAAVDAEPRNVDLLNLLGELYFTRKDLSHAGALFQRAGEADPKRWQPLRNLALVKLAQHDEAGAANVFQSALELAPTDPTLVGDAARVYEKQGKVDAAIAAYEALYEKNPKAKQFAANNLAMLLVTYRSDDDPSLERARQLTDNFVTSDNSALLDTVGWVRFKRGEYKDALPTLERAAERSPDARVIRYHLGMAQLQMGLTERARRNLEAASNGPDTFQGVNEARTALASLTRARS